MTTDVPAELVAFRVPRPIRRHAGFFYFTIIAALQVKITLHVNKQIAAATTTERASAGLGYSLEH
ncbi:hypothetical protein BRAS3843_830033 [Bradyrhizobium sp. STM 3843]|uniref:hypothetical protein n=1 Tax=Bradyrhizobium sp. STM 3843 TaxID=551947 RepID=UPI00024053C1|nr:hypothetical protein [Bradyrhizobium sp. STM 3843]CCE11816.1 hypothetical protein BRAS3843_830033 [Bradyrhizobium sp. STM 3843]